MSGLCTNEAEKADLAHLGSKEGKLRLQRKLKKHHKTLLSIFGLYSLQLAPILMIDGRCPPDEYTSIEIDGLGSFLSLVPLTEIKPRSYTISSSSKASPGQVHLTVSQHDK